MTTRLRKKQEGSTKQTNAHTGEQVWADALRLSELRYWRLFENAQDGILILDASGKIVDVNPFLVDLLDYPFVELRGRKLWEVRQFKEIAPHRAAFEKLQQNEYIRYENLPLQRRDGRLIQVEFVSNVYWVETEKVIQCNIREVTARAERQNESATKVAALEFANSEKDAWLIAHSQNLRAPLSSMGSMLGLMELWYRLITELPLEEKPSDFDEAALQHLRRNYRRLVHIFNELADLTGQGPLRCQSSQLSGKKTGVTFGNSANGSSEP